MLRHLHDEYYDKFRETCNNQIIYTFPKAQPYTTKTYLITNSFHKYSIKTIWCNQNGTCNNTNSNFFHHNLKFEHQGDTYFLQDRDFLKNSPKIEIPMTVDDGLTIYSQLQKNDNFLQTYQRSASQAYGKE